MVHGVSKPIKISQPGMPKNLPGTSRKGKMKRKKGKGKKEREKGEREKEKKEGQGGVCKGAGTTDGLGRGEADTWVDMSSSHRTQVLPNF